MANPLERRRVTSDAAQVESLKKELAELRENYARDMALVSEDIRQLARNASANPGAAL